MSIAQIIATLAGIGHLRPASGTWGSLAALPLFLLIHLVGGFPLAVIATIAVFALGWWATRVYTAATGVHDPSEVVIDEVAGQWVALWPVSLGAMVAGVPVTALWPGWILGFLAFRAFDIWKPGPVGWADRRSDPFGVMVDDILAGILAAITVFVAGAFYHVVLM